MKKLLTILMCLVLSLGMALAVGCGGNDDGAFGGDYKTATKAEVLAFAGELEDVENAEEIDFTKGLKMDFKMKVEFPGQESQNMEMNLKTSFKEGNFQMAGEIKDYQISSTETADAGVVYYKDGKAYAKAGEQKVSMTVDYDEILEELYGEAFESVASIEELITTFARYSENIEFSMEEKTESTKIKIEAKEEIDVEGSKGSVKCLVVFVFDANKALTAYKLDMDISGSSEYEGQKFDSVMQIYMSVEPFDGTIEFPSDLDTYVDESAAA